MRSYNPLARFRFGTNDELCCKPELLASAKVMHLSHMMQNADLHLLSSCRDFYAKVINPNGIQILGTPIATSVSKGRLETDKVSNLCIVY